MGKEKTPSTHSKTKKRRKTRESMGIPSHVWHHVIQYMGRSKNLLDITTQSNIAGSTALLRVSQRSVASMSIKIMCLEAFRSCRHRRSSRSSSYCLLGKIEDNWQSNFFLRSFSRLILCCAIHFDSHAVASWWKLWWQEPNPPMVFSFAEESPLCAPGLPDAWKSKTQAAPSRTARRSCTCWARNLTLELPKSSLNIHLLQNRRT